MKDTRNTIKSDKRVFVETLNGYIKGNTIIKKLKGFGKKCKTRYTAVFENFWLKNKKNSRSDIARQYLLINYNIMFSRLSE